MTSLPPPPASLPAPPVQGGTTTSTDSAYSAATISSGPQPASLYPPQPAPVMLPPLHYQGMDAPQPFGYQPPPAAPPMMHPARVAALAGSPVAVGTPPQAGMVRSADEMEGATEEIPPAKRQKVVKVPGSQLYSEEDWTNMHPVSTHCQITASHRMLTEACLAPNLVTGAIAQRPFQTRVETRWQGGDHPRSTAQLAGVDTS